MGNYIYIFILLVLSVITELFKFRMHYCFVGIGFKVKVNQSHYRSEVPRGFQQVKVPRLRDNGTGWW